MSKPNRGRGPTKPRNNQQSVANITRSFGESVSISGPGMTLFPPKPPRTGKAPGIEVALISNLFRLSIKQRKPIYQYAVNIEIKSDESAEAVRSKKISSEWRCDIINHALRQWLKEAKPKNINPQATYNYVFETSGSLLFALFNMFDLDSSDKKDSKIIDLVISREVIVGMELVKKDFLFTVKINRGTLLDLGRLTDYCSKPGSIDRSSLPELLRAVNTIVRGQLVTIPNYLLTKTNVFNMDKRLGEELSPGVVLQKGYFLSARVAESGLVLNVANTVCAMYEDISLVDFIQKRFKVRDLAQGLAPQIITKLKTEFFNKQVEARHQNFGKQGSPHYRKYRVGDIAGSARDQFDYIDKTTKKPIKISIFDYFKKQYNFQLKYPNLPCIVDRGRKIPLEVCYLVDKQRLTRKLDPMETAALIKKAALPAFNHFKQIEQNVADLKSKSKALNDFQIDFETRNIEVTGRELTPISMKGSKPIRPQNGEYQTRGLRFVKPAVINRWALVFICDRHTNKNKLTPEKFIELYTRAAIQRGININGKNCLVKMLDDVSPIELRKFVKYLNENQCDHCIFVLANNIPENFYRTLLYYEASNHGPKCTRLSCIKLENYIRKILEDRFGGEMFLSNIILKYNTKLGGINYVLDYDRNRRYLQDGYIFISVDVCHPAPGDKLIQSVAAVVGLWDVCNQNMSTCTRLVVQQKMNEKSSTIERVIDIGRLFREVVQSYKTKKSKLPSNIVIMRDGVSEGQFDMVSEYEIKQIKQALYPMYQTTQSPQPTISCMIVQKRHKVRFMRKQAVQTRKGTNDYNIQAGTVVDDVVTYPNEFNFYMAPHKAIQGTSRPPHITLVLDEIRFSQDEAQELVHALSYLSPRCTKSTSIPTPVNLADLAAERGKNLVIAWCDDLENKSQKLKDEERRQKLNDFLKTIGDNNYYNTLFYI